MRRPWRGSIGAILLWGCSASHLEQAPVDVSCETYCALAQLRCRNSQLLYPSLSACQTACAAFPDVGGLGVAQGDSLQCRLTYLMATTANNALSFCQNAGASGGMECTNKRAPTP
jgi:hypothetical protein